MTGPEDILRFWFGAKDDPEYGRFRNIWFSAEAKLDEEIRRRFQEAYEQAAAGKLDHWQGKPQGALALVILLDQFPRNMFRGSARTYEADVQALAAAKDAVAKGLDEQLPDFQRWFLYMPFMHSENVDDQRRAVELFSAKSQANLKYALHHRKIIERFGRFPHRNEILGRESTPKEKAWLKRRSRP